MNRWLLSGFLSALTVVMAEEPPVVPVGYDAFRQWDRWPYQRIGVRAYMRSTYDRSGGNEGADASHFLYQGADDFNVTLDVENPGILYFARYNHWHGSPWHYLVDDKHFIVQESSTPTPRQPKADSVFLPEHAFPNPLTWTWSKTQGADLSWVPIPFQSAFTMAYSRTHYGTGYYIYHQFVRGIPLSTRLRSWDTNAVPPPDVLELISRSGGDLLAGESLTTGALSLQQQSGSTNVPAQSHSVVADLEKAPAVIRLLEFSLPRDQAVAFGRAFLRITWDHRAFPSVHVPLSLFFGAGTLYNRTDREFLVKAFPMNIRFSRDRAQLRCFFPMPFFRSARIELVNSNSAALQDVRWQIRFAPFRDPPSHVGYFHATYHDHPSPTPGHDLVLLDTRQEEGGGQWSGSFVGNSWIFSHRAVLQTLEGDPRFFFDDSQSPQAYGTGTEEWAGGGDYWGGQNMTLPFVGHPTGAPSPAQAQSPEDQIESAYRFLLSDLMPFGKNAVIQLEHGGENESTEHYQTVTYWYGLPAASLIKTDELNVGESASESSHQYRSPQASPPYAIRSRYEWGVNLLHGREIFPEQTMTGRVTVGRSEFAVDLRPDNYGVLLRRTLDYSFPNQRAEVEVADDSGGVPLWKQAGIWFLAGSNRCVYSNPRDELGATQHIVETSNRQFRDDEFLVPRELTQGRARIRVRLSFTPVRQPLFPGYSFGPLAWSEIRYSAYCFILPEFSRTNP